MFHASWSNTSSYHQWSRGGAPRGSLRDCRHPGRCHRSARATSCRDLLPPTGLSSMRFRLSPHRVQVEPPRPALAGNHDVARGWPELVAERPNRRIRAAPPHDVAHAPRLGLASVEGVAAVDECPAEGLGDEAEGLVEGPADRYGRRPRSRSPRSVLDVSRTAHSAWCHCTWLRRPSIAERCRRSWLSVSQPVLVVIPTQPHRSPRTCHLARSTGSRAGRAPGALLHDI